MSTTSLIHHFNRHHYLHNTPDLDPEPRSRRASQCGASQLLALPLSEKPSLIVLPGVICPAASDSRVLTTSSSSNSESLSTSDILRRILLGSNKNNTNIANDIVRSILNSLGASTIKSDIITSILHSSTCSDSTRITTDAVASRDTEMDLLQHIDGSNVSDSSDTEDFLQELAALNDVGLLRATMESLECGRLTPLIKEELRCRIQSRRLSEGKEELFVEFPSPTPSQPRPDEMEKRDRRREQNRRAAQKFRRKKKERGEHLIEETQRLECHNTTLMSEIKQLHEEREQLTRIIQSHANICPLTPRQSPLTVARESPIPGSIRESPLTLPSFSGNILAASPVLGRSSVLGPSPVLLVPPTRESPVPLLIINSGGDASISASLIPSSPIPMSGRPRKSPVSLLRINQSPIPGDKTGGKSPILFGSPPKQSKHSIPPRLNLAGPKPVIPILPKPSTNFPSSPSPKTPRTFITSPLPIAPSPVSGGRAIHVSPIFFREGCFTPSGHARQISHSPISVSSGSSSSTPGRIAQQSPVFFGDRAPSSAQSSSHFLQPLSASSVSSTSSLASLLRQESPLSVLSNSSGISNASTVFISNTSSLHSNVSGISERSTAVSNNGSSLCNSNTNFGIPNRVPDKPRSTYSSTSHSSFPENPEDNVLSLEDIEKSASGFEARDDLLDFMDIQALLELSGDHNGSAVGEPVTDQPAHPVCCHSVNQSGTAMEDLQIDDDQGDLDSGNGLTGNALIDPRLNQCQQTCRPPISQPLNAALCSSSLTSNSNADSRGDIRENVHAIDNSTIADDHESSFGITHEIGQNQSAFVGRSSSSQCESSISDEQENSLRHLCSTSAEQAFQNYTESQHGSAATAASIRQFHSQLRELINSQNRSSEIADYTTIKRLLGNEVTNVQVAGQNDRENNSRQTNMILNSYLPTDDNVSATDAGSSDSDLLNLQSSFSLDMLAASHVGCNGSTDSIMPQTGHQFT